MEIKYANRTAERQFDPKYESTWRYPKQVETKLKAAKQYIENASSLLDIYKYPPFHFERLIGDRKDEWSISLGKKSGYRVTLIPCDDNGKKLLTGDIISQSKTIRIVCVTEVSNHYE